MLAGLDGDERVAQHVVRRRADLVGILRQPHAALGVGAEFLELALAAAAGMNLRLHHIDRPRQLFRSGDGFVYAHRCDPRRNRHAEFREDFLGLIFVDVHERMPLPK